MRKGYGMTAAVKYAFEISCGGICKGFVGFYICAYINIYVAKTFVIIGIGIYKPLIF